MSTPAKAHEPSMEEILASIRRIISDDEPADAKAPEREPSKSEPAPTPSPETAAQDLGQDDIDAMFAAMDNTTAAAAPAPKPALTPPPATEAIELEDDLDVLELTDEVAPAPAPPAALKPRRAAPPPPPPRETPSPPVGERLLSNEANATVSNAFGSLTNTILAGNARTLDDIVREMLRPMLRAWLDDNLPPLVERLVRQEIERVARGGR